MKHSICLVTMIIIIVVLLQGCLPPNVGTKPDTFVSGCKIIDANLSAGMVNSQGGVETCALVCSDNIPKGLKLKYDARGCNIEVDNGK